MKTYKIKNYKGNLVESLSRFQEGHKGMKIVEAVEEDGSLKIIAEEFNIDSELNLREKIYNLLQDRLWLPDRKINSFTDSIMGMINENPSNIDFENLKEKIFKFLLDEIWAPSSKLQRLADSIVDKIKEELHAIKESDDPDANLAVEHGAKYFEALAKALEMTFSEDVNNNEESFEVWKELLRFIDEKQIAITPSEDFNRKFDLIASEFDNALAKL